VEQLEFRLVIEPRVKPVVEGALTFEAGATREQTADPDLYVYEHHGSEFGQTDPGALTSFFEDLILGRPMPLVFLTPEIKDVDTLFAIAIFLHRDLAIAPGIAGIVAQVDLVHRRGLPVLGHVGDEFARFLRLLRAYFPPSGLSSTEVGNRLTTAVDWIRAYALRGEFPTLGKPFAEVRVLQRGTDGFVVAETSGDLLEAWVSLFAQGHLRGCVIAPERAGRRQFLCARKSAFCAYNLTWAAKLLNEVETSMGEKAEWRVEGDWLWGPPQGTVLMVQHVLGVLVRV
jgi:hypothetical protein